MKGLLVLFLAVSGFACAGSAFVYVGGGYSWSMKGDISAPAIFWDPSPQGYNDDLRESEFYTLGFGYRVWCPLSIGLDVTYRPEYQYRRFQSSAAAGTPGFLGDKTRFFKLTNLAFMANVFANRMGEYWAYDCGCMCVYPFLGAGIGISYNRLHDLHSISNPTTAIFSQARSIMAEHTQTAFAAQVFVGLGTWLCDCLSFDFGYRYFYGGSISSNNYTLDVPGGFPSPAEVPAWKGHLHANEFFLQLNYVL